MNLDRQRLKTDQGRWYLLGWGGAKGSLYWSLDEELFGQKEVHFPDLDFRGSANGEITVRLNLPDDYLERILKLPAAFESDPGNASLLREPQTPPDPTDPANVPAGAARVFIKLPGPGFSVVTKIVSAPEDVKFRYETIDLDGHVGLQVSIGTVLNYRLTGPMGWHSEPVQVNTTDQPVQVITPQPDMPTWLLRTPSISPTLDAFGAFVQFGLRVHDSAVDKAGPDHGRQWLWLPRNGDGWQLQVPQTCPLSNSLRTPEYVAYAGTGTLFGGARYQYPDGRRDFDYWEEADFTPLSVKLSPRGIWPGEATKWLEQARTSGLDLAPQAGTICLRAVDRGAQGLPMVEAVLLTAEQDALLSPLRERAAKLKTPPQLALPAKGESAAPALGTWESVALTPEERAHVLANNAWYFVQRRIRGDPHGYLCDQQNELLAGKRYVLYLWSASRNDRTPDLRIEFEAGPGVTDLGVVVLPEYR
jgi:hypothetical protein